jgi:hypothetical protein
LRFFPTIFLQYQVDAFASKFDQVLETIHEVLYNLSALQKERFAKDIPVFVGPICRIYHAILFDHPYALAQAFGF